MVENCKVNDCHKRELTHEIDKLRLALCWGVGAALNELQARGLPLEWSPDGGIGKMLEALGVTATTMTDDVWDVVQGHPTSPTLRRAAGRA